MKLVIDIPDKKYKWIKEDTLCYTDEISEAIRNGTPLEEELEKIKVDFEELANDEWNIQVGASKGLECAIDLIEDRIYELKGENK